METLLTGVPGLTRHASSFPSSVRPEVGSVATRVVDGTPSPPEDGPKIPQGGVGPAGGGTCGPPVFPGMPGSPGVAGGSPGVCPELAGLVDAVSVSLNAPDAATYAKICPSRYGESAYPFVKEFIREIKKHVPDVTASVVTVPGLDVEACRKIVEDELGVQFRAREYQNVG